MPENLVYKINLFIFVPEKRGVSVRTLFFAGIKFNK